MNKPHAGKWLSALVLIVAIVLVPCMTLAVAAGEPDTSRPGVCEREGAKIAGMKPVRPGQSIRAPKKVRNVKPSYPELPRGTTGSGMWAGEVLLDTNGNVSHVWAIRKVRLTPDLPTFNQAIVDAIEQWQFEPLIVDGSRAAVCMPVTVNINWQ